jgi:DNA-binding transcriptional regulator/RsmH inhibitor MraZ
METIAIDTDGRLTLPVIVDRWIREYDPSGRILVTSLDDNTLLIFPLDRFAEIEEAMRVDYDRQVVRRVLLAMNSRGLVIDIDEHGSLRLPPSVAPALLGRTVVIIWRDGILLFTPA